MFIKSRIYEGGLWPPNQIKGKLYKLTLSKILCKWKQDSAVSLFPISYSVFIRQIAHYLTLSEN